jgi:aminopeptidase N
VDPESDENWFLLKAEAQDRAKAVSAVSYKVAVSLKKGGGTYHGVVEVLFSLSRLLEDQSSQGAEVGHLFFDYKGRQVKSMTVNGSAVEKGSPVFAKHKLFVPHALQKIGENKVVVEFESSFVNDCSGLHYFRDPADGSEYCYTELEPYSCHKWFPCFDQPDIKASYELLVLCAPDWVVTSTCRSRRVSQ